MQNATDRTVGIAFWVALTAATAGAAIEPVFKTGDPAPGGGTFDIFNRPVINNAGQVAFRGALQSGTGKIWLDNAPALADGDSVPGAADTIFAFFGDTLILNDAGQLGYKAILSATGDLALITDLTLRARENHLVQGGKPANPDRFWEDFDNLHLDDNGDITFTGDLTSTFGFNNAGIFRNNDTVIAASNNFFGEVVPAGVDPEARFASANNHAVSPNGQVAFSASLQIGPGGVTSSDEQGIWTSQRLVAREDGFIGPARFLNFPERRPSINRLGQVAFVGQLQESGSVTPLNNTGIWLDHTEIVRRSDPAPGIPTGGMFNIFSPPLINDAGDVAFIADLIPTTTVSDLENSGIWVGDRLAVQEGAQAPGAPDGAVFRAFIAQVVGRPEFPTDPTPFAVNRGGQIVFAQSLRQSFGGVDDTNDEGLWIFGPNGDGQLLVREGDNFDGKTVESFDIALGSGGGDSRARSINDAAEVVFEVRFTDDTEGVYKFTPQPRWIAPGDGNWDNTDNWTLGINPGPSHDVTIDPAGPRTITGPATTANVNSLTVGGGTGTTTLALHGGALAAATPIQITPNGILTGDGTIDADVENHGTVLADNVTVTENLTNHRLITGDGFINGTIINAADGTIEAIGNDLGFNGTVTNNDGGLISARNALLRFQGTGLTNHGRVGFSFGTTDVFGNVDNDGGQIIAQGTTNVTFWDDVVNNGTFIVDTDARVVFFGATSGSGSFPGEGTVVFNGEFSPGTSPGRVSIAGDAAMGATAVLNLELAGLTQGDDYDHLDIAGQFAADGTLHIKLINGFNPRLGDSFDLLDFHSTTGAFSNVLLPTLPHGLTFDTTSLPTNGTITVVPEPASTTTAILTLLTLTTHRPRRPQPPQPSNGYHRSARNGCH